MKMKVAYPNPENMEMFLKLRFLPEHWKQLWSYYDGGQHGNTTLAQNQCHWVLIIGRFQHRCFMDDYGNMFYAK